VEAFENHGPARKQDGEVDNRVRFAQGWALRRVSDGRWFLVVPRDPVAGTRCEWIEYDRGEPVDLLIPNAGNYHNVTCNAGDWIEFT